MGGDEGVGWPTCSEDECIGIRLDKGGKCLAHADEEDLDAELKRLGNEGTIDARGVPIGATLLDRIRAAAPRDEQQPDRPRFNKVRFDRATFGDKVSFDRAAFGDGARFDDATFGEWASFDDATFGSGARFGRATFGDEVSFGNATFGNGARFGGAAFAGDARFGRAAFGDEASFGNATFGNSASFEEATFGRGTMFGGATFGEGARFGRATFGDWASFDDATFADQASFDDATFRGEARFDGATFGDWASFDDATFGNRARFHNATLGDWASFGNATFGNWARFDDATFGDEASFGGATFGDWARFGPLLGGGRLILDQATFGQGCELAISADRLDCRGARLPYGAALNVHWAEVRLDGVDFGQPSVLVGVGPFPGLDEDALRPRVERCWRTERPRVLSLRGSDVRNLVLSNVDLRACRFSGAHNLDQLRLEATIDLADQPAGVRAGWAVPPLWRWTRRRTLAEEHRWRRAQAKHAGWYPRSCRVQGLAGQERALRSADIALLYRALRKGREDSKDEPGAADFYYGEMEMRRHDRTAPWPERVVLWLYWLVAGYGLRASRAFGWLLGLLAVATVLLAVVGFPPAPPATPLSATVTGMPPQQRSQFDTNAAPVMAAERPFPDRLGTAALVAVEGAVFRSSEQALTYEGRLIQASLRFVGPVLLGLGLLSIRGRVKR